MVRTYLILCLVPLLGACSLVGGGTAPRVDSAIVHVCPHTYDWTPDQIKQLGVEDAKLSPKSMAHRAISEGYDIRAQIKSDCGVQHVAQ